LYKEIVGVAENVSLYASDERKKEVLFWDRDRMLKRTGQILREEY